MAVWPDDSTLERLATLQLETTERLRLVGRGNWHVTLQFLGEVDDALVPQLADALGTAAATLAGPVRCRVGPKTAWFGDRVLHIPARGLEDLAAAVRSATIPVVSVRSDKELRFNGHLTIARTTGHRLDTSARRSIAGIPVAANFEVDSFDLVASEHSSEGRRYTTLVTLLLRG